MQMFALQLAKMLTRHFCYFRYSNFKMTFDKKIFVKNNHF